MKQHSKHPKHVSKRESRILRIEGNFEVWGIFVDGVLVREMKLRLIFAR